MMSPAKWWWELLQDPGEETPATDLEDQSTAGIPQDDPRYLSLHLKRKHQTNLLKKMLSEGGYPDLARMTTISRVSEGD